MTKILEVGGLLSGERWRAHQRHCMQSYGGSPRAKTYGKLAALAEHLGVPVGMVVGVRTEDDGPSEQMIQRAVEIPRGRRAQAHG
jgi:hypothetical protein